MTFDELVVGKCYIHVQSGQKYALIYVLDAHSSNSFGRYKTLLELSNCGAIVPGGIRDTDRFVPINKDR